MSLTAFITLFCYHGVADHNLESLPLNSREVVIFEVRAALCQGAVTICESKHPVAFKINPEKTMVVCKNERNQRIKNAKQ